MTMIPDNVLRTECFQVLVDKFGYLDTERFVVMMSARVMEAENVSLQQALRIVYGSKLYEKLQNPETGLYREGPVYLYDMLCEERGAKREGVV